MIQTILLTGSTGFLGSHLLGQLLKKKYTVIILKRGSSEVWRIKHLLPHVTSYDVDSVRMEEIFTRHKIDAVLHLATHYKKVHETEDVTKFVASNIAFPNEILQQMALHGVRFFVNTGTFSEYEISTTPMDEHTSTRAQNLYAASKLAFAEIVKYYTKNFDIKAVDLKLFSPYGPKDNEKLFVYIVKSFAQNKQFEVTKGEQEWNWTYCHDIVDAYMKSIAYIETMESSYEVFNIGHHEVHSIREIISLLEEFSGRTGLVSFTRPYPENEIFYVNCNNAKAQKKLGWVPQFNLRKGLKDMYHYYLS